MFSSANFIFLSFTCCSVSQSCLCLTVCDPMNYSMPGFPVLHHLPEFAQPHVLWVSDAMQPEIYNSCGSVQFSSVQFISVTQSCPTLCDPMNCSMPGLLFHHQHPEFTQTHVHRVGDGFQPSHPLSSPSPSAPNPSQHQSLLQWVNSSHEVAKVLEFQL